VTGALVLDRPEPPARPQPPAPRRPAGVLDPAWPITALTIGMAPAYFLGLSWLVWILPVFAFGLPLLRRRQLRIPPGLLPLIALAAWIPVTALALPTPAELPMFVFRWLVWVSAVVSMVWVCNTATTVVSTERIVDMLGILWITFIGFGYLALLFPATAAPSLLQRVMPQGLLDIQAINDLTIVRFAELQTFATGVVPRPAAPLPATNGWGSTLGLLTPFFVLAWLTAASHRRRVWGWIFAAIALVPLVVSTNRGAWLSIGVALAYFAFRRAIVGDARPLFFITALAALVVAAVLFTPLDQVVATRLDSSNESNAAREDVYQLAYTKTLDSPLLGYGAPQQKDQPPPIGTHGLLWYTMFCHGFTGVLLLLAALGALFATTMRARTPTALWAHIAILICIVQVPYYGLLPQLMLVGIAAGIAWRENHPVEAARELR
jgi:O-antigen ligase